MHKSIKGLVLFAAITAITVLTVFFISSCAKDERAKEVKKEDAATAKKYDFETPDVCSGCHNVIFSQWKSTMHANAFTDPLYLKEAELAGKEAGEEVQQFCHSCHAPAAALMGKVPTDISKSSKIVEITKLGVFCDFCHTVKSSRGIGNPKAEVITGNVKRGPYKDSYSPYHESEYSELHTKAEFCGMCHDVYHPVNKLPIEQTYTEWKEGPYSKEGIVCQDCHMTPGPQITKPNPGVVATGGPHRDHWWTHNFIGANVFMARYLGNEEVAIQAEERLKSAAKMEFGSASVSANKVSLPITITNVGAGHKLPTGLTELRHMWIELVVKDSKGNTIYSSGVLSPDGALPQNTKIFYTIIGDKQGKPTLKIWEAEKILMDNRIPPRQSATETFEFDLPPGATGPFNAEARLLYRSVFQEVVDKLFEDKPRVPAVEMTKATTSF